MTCSWELKSGEDEPEVKLYVPLWQYAASDGEIVRNLGEMFRMRGWQWGGEGEYAKVIADALWVSPLFPLLFSFFSFNDKCGSVSEYFANPTPF